VELRPRRRLDGVAVGVLGLQAAAAAAARRRHEEVHEAFKCKK